MQVKALILTTRLPFLILTPVCVFLGVSTSMAVGTPIDMGLLILILFGALSAHISVNTLNEYTDFKSGLDIITQKTAFSGGSGALPNSPDTANATLLLGIITLVLAISIGLYLSFERGASILPIGIMGVFLVVTYTKWLNRYPIICMIAPGLGFGVFMVVGTHLILSGAYSNLAWMISLVPFLLINNLLLLNQYPDVEADRTIGRRTFPISFGFSGSNIVYAFSFTITYLLVLFYILEGFIPSLSYIAIVPVLFSVTALLGACRTKSRVGNYPVVLASNVAAAVLTPLLLAISIIYG